MPKPNRQQLSRLHSRLAEDAAWRVAQAQIDADIEGLARDPESERFIAEMDAAGVSYEEQIERLKVYFVSRRDRGLAVS